MKLTKLYKDPQSGGQGCPSVYVADTGELVIQGQKLGAGDMAQLDDVLEGETALRIRPDIILGAVERYRQGGAQ